MDPIKDAFSKIKEDIQILQDSFIHLKKEISNLKEDISSIKKHVSEQTPISKSHDFPIYYPSNEYSIPRFQLFKPQTLQTLPKILEVNLQHSTDTSSHRQSSSTEISGLEALSMPKEVFSSGNGGVQTNKPLDSQTIQQTPNTSSSSSGEISSNYPNSIEQTFSEIEKANEIISSLDDIKKELRLKFKALTNQEMLVFSTIYALQDQNITEIDYSLLARTISLTESSIRDYANKLMKKGIPIIKRKVNNKKILLSISDNLRKIAPLSTITKLRDL